MRRSQIHWARKAEPVRGEDEYLRERMGLPPLERGSWRVCQAMILVNDRYVQCGRNPVDRHHRLTKARGGRILDKAGETYHLMDLCREHHSMADGGDARAGGLLIDGYVTTCTQCERPKYVGADEYLAGRYGPTAHVQCVPDREGSPIAGT